MYVRIKIHTKYSFRISDLDHDANDFHHGRAAPLPCMQADMHADLWGVFYWTNPCNTN